MTDLELLLAQISQAERQVGLGERLIARRRALIQRLRDDGRDTAGAEGLLRQFEASQATHVATLALLLEERDRRSSTPEGDERPSGSS